MTKNELYHQWDHPERRRATLYKYLTIPEQLLYVYEAVRRAFSSASPHTELFYSTILQLIETDPLIDQSRAADLQGAVGHLRFKAMSRTTHTLMRGNPDLINTLMRGLTQTLLQRQAAKHQPTSDHKLAALQDLTLNVNHTAWLATICWLNGDVEDTKRHTFHLFAQIGSPLHRIVLHPEWVNSTTTALARQIRVSRNTDLLPILADALQDAGCDDEELLTQLRHETNGHSPSSWIIRQLTATNQ